MNDGGANTVLLVDDDVAVLEMLTDALSDLPITLLTTDSPDKAIELLGNLEIAVLMSDLHMADDTDGNAVLAAARHANHQIVSVLMSGDMGRADVMKALNEGGIWKCLDKPLDIDEVRDLVKDGIARYNKLKRPQEKLKALAQAVTIVIKGQEDELASPELRPSLAVTKTPVAPSEGESVGDRYKLLAVLGEGSAGKVYLANDALLHKKVALKILNPDLTTDDFSVAAMKDEARIAMELSHRNIVRLHNFERSGSTYFLVMEYVEGCALRDVVAQDGALDPDAVVFVLKVCSSALSYAHGRNIVHKDLKPENILISDMGVVKIIDFGLACLVDTQKQQRYVAGTPIYMSPEQKRGQTVDARTDIYSLGIITYELLTGKTPFGTVSSHMDILNMEAEPLTGLPEELLDILEKAIATDREDRWSSVSDFADAFVKTVRSWRPD